MMSSLVACITYRFQLFKVCRFLWEAQVISTDHIQPELPYQYPLGITRDVLSVTGDVLGATRDTPGIIMDTPCFSVYPLLY